MAAVEIDLFSDLVCPWCFVGAHRLDHVLATEPTGAEVTVRHQPFLLQPDTPPEGIDIAAMLRSRYGADPSTMFARVEAAARESDLALDLRRQPRMYSTVAAHTLLRHAAAHGTQRALTRSLFDAYFLQGRNISDPSELAAIATSHGFSSADAMGLCTDADELILTRQLAREASTRGIRGVPFFVFNQRVAMSGAQPEEALRGALRQATASA